MDPSLSSVLRTFLVEKPLLQLIHIKSFLLKLVQMHKLVLLLVWKLIEFGISFTLQAWPTKTLVELRLPHDFLKHSVALFLAIQIFFMLVEHDCFNEADDILCLGCLVDPACKCQVHEDWSHKCGETKEDTRVESSWRWSGQKWGRDKHAEDYYSKSAELLFLPIFFVIFDLFSHHLSEIFLQWFARLWVNFLAASFGWDYGLMSKPSLGLAIKSQNDILLLLILICVSSLNGRHFFALT